MGLLFPWKNHVKNQEVPVPPPTPFVESVGMGEEDWVLLVGYFGDELDVGIGDFCGTKDGLESFPLFLLGP